MHAYTLSAITAPGHLDVLKMAWPIVLANSAVPLLGLADTAVIGNTGTVVDLGRCTYAEEDMFFSYRRTTHRGEHDYGRLIAAIVLE